MIVSVGEYCHIQMMNNFKLRPVTCDLFPSNPHLFLQVQVLMGTCAGCLGKPQGFPCHSLDIYNLVKLPQYSRCSPHNLDLSVLPTAGEQLGLLRLGKRILVLFLPHPQNHVRKLLCNLWTLNFIAST